MVVRKSRRRHTVVTLETYHSAEFDHRAHGGRGDGSEVGAYADLHAELFADAEHVEAFYREHHATFNTMRTRGDGRHPHHALHHDPGRRHPLWWRHDSPEPRDESGNEYLQLKALGVLKDDEIAELKRQAAESDRKLHCNPHTNLPTPFRRPPSFWEFVASEPRDESAFESSQLIRLGVLTDLEQRILDDPRAAAAILPGRGNCYHLPDDERELLGLAERQTQDT